MSAESVKTIVILAVTDPEFRDTLFDEPDKALEDYELTAEETSALQELSREEFDTMAVQLEERISRAGPGGMLGARSFDGLDLGRFGQIANCYA